MDLGQRFLGRIGLSLSGNRRLCQYWRRKTLNRCDIFADNRALSDGRPQLFHGSLSFCWLFECRERQFHGLKFPIDSEKVRQWVNFFRVWWSSLLIPPQKISDWGILSIVYLQSLSHFPGRCRGHFPAVQMNLLFPVSRLFLSSLTRTGIVTAADGYRGRHSLCAVFKLPPALTVQPQHSALALSSSRSPEFLAMRAIASVKRTIQAANDIAFNSDGNGSQRDPCARGQLRVSRKSQALKRPSHCETALSDWQNLARTARWPRRKTDTKPIVIIDPPQYLHLVSGSHDRPERRTMKKRCTEDQLLKLTI